MKMKIKRMEGLIAKVEDLEGQITRLKSTQKQTVKDKEPVH
jgi:hypothetical protein